MDTVPTFSEFRNEWLANVTDGSPSTVELGRRFARKLLTQWLDIDEANDEIIYCDGSGDGGIDIAYLYEGDTSDETEVEGHTWYLVQSKYGKAFQGDTTLLKEAQKVINTLDSPSKRISSLTQDLLEQLITFRRRASERDRIVLVFATEGSLTNSQAKTLKDVCAMGRARLHPVLFDVEHVSIETIYKRALEGTPGLSRTLSVPLSARNLPKEIALGENLLICSISLFDLYKFLDSYHDKTGDLDQIYEKNLRRFLGGRGKVNRAIQQTLKEAPEQFGLYNNGITIVATEFRINENGSLRLTDPYIVNGCQTTRTIWDVFRKRLKSGGTGVDADLLNWQKQAEKGVVVTKVVRIGRGQEELLEKITRYTNSQNAVKEKDFTALDSDFKMWKREMEEKYNIFLEIQRGAWDSQRAWQKQHPSEKAFDKHANAFDLLKVYGAGWLGETGNAMGRNAAFLPNGVVFKKIVNPDNTSNTVGADDLFAAYQLQQAADLYKFGRTAERTTRSLSRYMFYCATIELLKRVMTHEGLDRDLHDLTNALNKLFKAGEQDHLLDAAIEAIDEYFMPSTDNSLFDEPSLKNMNNNLVRYLKSEQIGKGEIFIRLLGDFARQLGKGKPAPRETIIRIIRS